MTHPTQNQVTDERVAIARTLRDTALYLTRHGWTQGSYYDQTATVFTPAACTVGGIGMVCYGGPVDAPAQHFHDPSFADFDTAVAFLDWDLSTWAGTNVYDWNDDRARTAEQVVATLARVAGLCENGIAYRVWDAYRTGIATTATLLRWAGLYLTRCGWDPTGAAVRDETASRPPLSLHGAIDAAVHQYVSTTDPDDEDLEAIDIAYDLAVAALYKVTGDWCGPIDDDYDKDGIAWELTPGRTADEVITAIYAAADRWDSLNLGGAR